ncbi:hypothetical protein DL96DRAFT_1470755 [Flagelloscypha sp. PMI_526]|nr:hypothetical protein DL96DRAFT_1470755 [Flagelloscypha sp. PMI_526]
MPLNVWGISAPTCDAFCGHDKLIQGYGDAAQILITLSTWLFPFLALIAQLPFEADGPANNFISGAMALGSPVMVTYSLVLTTLNRNYVQNIFNRMRREEKAKNVQSGIKENLKTVPFILGEVQHAPIRVSQRDSWLSSLICLEENVPFWSSVKEDLLKTGRRFTYSFWAQVLFATFAYISSFVAAMKDDLGDPAIGLHFATSIVWSWMLPIVYGYVFVGCQHRDGCIYDALNKQAYCEGQDVDGASIIPSSQSSQHQSQISQVTSYPPSQVLRPPKNHSPKWWGLDVRGDERKEGPIFNYARVHTWFNLVEHIKTGFENTLANAASTSDTAEICGFEDGELEMFSKRRSHVRASWHMFSAALIALFLQWGTTTAGIVVAYLTPMVGLGCRSGSFLLYGLLATLAWAVLVVASELSYTVMSYHEHQIIPSTSGVYLPWRIKIYTALAIALRFFGKILVVLNAGWLIAFSIMEDLGFFQNCWCQTDALQYKMSGWTPVFKAAIDLRGTASGVWSGGFAMSIAICILVGGFFHLSLQRR